MPHQLSRRSALGLALGAGLGGLGTSTPALSIGPKPHKPLQFPRDYGAHPDYAIEWWYATGFLNVQDIPAAFGFQVTFFRRRVPQTQGMQSSLAAKQLLFAHAALTDVPGRKLWHDQRIARSSGAEPGQNSTDLASASTRTTFVQLRDWSLQRTANVIRAQISATEFSLALTFVPSQPVLLQGTQGLSRKGPEGTQTSFYYSQPQLQVQGEVVLRGKRHSVGPGSMAWLDHEWSQEMLHPQVVGWDWMGINLLDGSALTAFQLRDKDAGVVWDGGSIRRGKSLLAFQRAEVQFKPIRYWNSPLSHARYPVEWAVHTPTGDYTVQALVDNQELDSRATTGAIYWEGLCDVRDRNGQLVGRGYLEMTGYAAPMQL